MKTEHEFIVQYVRCSGTTRYWADLRQALQSEYVISAPIASGFMFQYLTLDIVHLFQDGTWPVIWGPRLDGIPCDHPQCLIERAHLQ